MTREQFVLAAVAAFNGQEVSAFLTAIHPEIEWVEAPDYPGNGVYRGADGVLESLAKWWEAWEEMTTIIETMEERGDRLLALGRITVRGGETGLSFESETGIVYDFEGELIRRVQLFTSHAQAREAAGF